MEGQIPRAGGAVDWLAAARSLGSDVPFFLAGTGALVEGTGERVTAVGSLPPWWTVVVRPPVDVATAAAYRMLDDERERAPLATRPRSTSASLDAVEALQRRDFGAVAGLLGNDFEQVVLRAYPEVARAHAALAEASGGRVLLSGSGSCSFALFETQAPARAAAARIAAARRATAFVATIRAAGRSGDERTSCFRRWRARPGLRGRTRPQPNKAFVAIGGAHARRAHDRGAAVVVCASARIPRRSTGSGVRPAPRSPARTGCAPSGVRMRR